jgi:putative copper export protein
VLAGLVPDLRKLSPDTARTIARRFAQLAWPAYGVLVVTGIWNVVAVDPTWGSAYGTTLVVKIVVVAISGISAWAHARSRSRAGLAIWGATAAISAAAALLLGVLLHG